MLGLALTRLDAVDARTAEASSVDRWFQAGGPLGEIPRGDKCCSLSHRAAWERLLASGAPYAAVLEDDVVLQEGAAFALGSSDWIPARHRSHQAGTLWPARPERAAFGFHGSGPGLSPGAHAFAPYRGRGLYPVAQGGGIAAGDSPLRSAGRSSSVQSQQFENCSPASSPGNCCRPWRGSRISWATNPISKAGGWGSEIRPHLCEARTDPLRL